MGWNGLRGKPGQGTYVRTVTPTISSIGLGQEQQGLGSCKFLSVGAKTISTTGVTALTSFIGDPSVSD